MNIKVLALLAFALWPAQVLADDLVLADGRYLQVKLLGASEKALHVKVLDTGGEIWIPWTLIREKDRTRLMIKYGYKQEEQVELTVPGVRLVTKTGDEFFGVPKGDWDKQNIPDPVEIMHRGTVWPFKKDVVRKIEWIDVPAQEVYTPTQLYEQKLAQTSLDDEDLEGHWDLGAYANQIGLYEKAVEHYLKVREIDPAYRAEFVQNQVDRLEVLAKNRRVVDAVKAAKREARFKRFSRALEQLDQIIAIEDLDPNIKADTILAKEGVEKRRWDYYMVQVRRGYFAMMDNLIGKMARDSKLKLKEAQKELRRELHKKIVAALADKYGLDQKKEVEKMWEEREVHGRRTASYGSGTFIVLGKAPGAQRRQQQLQRQMQRQQQQQRGRNRGRGGRNNNNSNNGQMKMPKPPSKDDWWNKLADSGMKGSWMKAYFAENGKKLEVVGERKYNCQRCGGTGSIKFSGGQGEAIPVTCPRCQGHKHDKGVQYK